MDGDATTLTRAAAAVVALEAVALAAFAIADLVAINPDRLALGATNAVFFFGYAVGLALCAYGLIRLRRWCRGPIVLAQIIQLGVAWSFASRATAWLTVTLAVPALVVLGGVLAPSTTNALYGTKTADDG